MYRRWIPSTRELENINLTIDFQLFPCYWDIVSGNPCDHKNRDKTMEDTLTAHTRMDNM